MKSEWIVVLAFAALPAGASLGAGAYNISLLPVPTGATYVYVGAISPGGLVAGEVFVGDHDTRAGYMQPVKWQNGVVTMLQLPTGFSGEVRAINDSGSVSGGIWQGPIPSGVSPVVWQNGQLQTLPTLGMASGEPVAINAQGVMVGAVANAEGSASNAVLWANGQATQLGGVPGQQVGAWGVNGHDQVLLTAGDGSEIATYVWSNGNLVSVSGITSSTVNGADGAAINDSGQVVGASLSTDGTSHAFLWQNGTTMDLGKAPGEVNSMASAINASGEIVGSGYGADVGSQALLWENGQLFNLNDLITRGSGWILENAVGIADDGTIVGNGLYNGQNAAFLLTPIASNSASPAPEPATAGLVLLGGTLLLGRRRWKV